MPGPAQRRLGPHSHPESSRQGGQAQRTSTQEDAPATTQPSLVSLEELTTSHNQLPGLGPPPPPSPATEDATSLPAEPPRLPHPWLWRCNNCGWTARLSATTRCLSCSSRFSANKAGTRTRRRRKRGGPSVIMFDTEGWEAWGLWRRNNFAAAAAVVAPPNTLEQDKRHRGDLFDAGEYSCDTHCDSPLQCRVVAAMRRRAAEIREQCEREKRERLREASRAAERGFAELQRLWAPQRGGDARMVSLSPVTEEGEEAEVSWFSDSSSSSSSEEDTSSSEDDVEMEYVEDTEAEAEAAHAEEETKSQLEVNTGRQRLARPPGLGIVVNGRGSPVFSIPVSPESPIENPGEVFLGAGMDSDEWAEEVALMGSIGLSRSKSF